MPRNSSLLYYILYISIGFVYPAYCSLNALNTPDKKDDSIWLIYWIVFAIYTLLEVGLDMILFWLPLYSYLKLFFLLWCAAPIGKNGAYYIFKIFIEPFFRMYGGHINYYLTQVVETAKSSADYIPAYPK
ncbi:receptor expression-enhancing protein 5 [Parasteatoda tepidariorum]|uniref:Receptor expression-enhancing protein n=1 Tax=Parasteatoda tepidariorum TaxID=114398 RepID=A0A2L2XY96_PARTP|nr:receptor expression-enhancing protein 5 [Parasteatoda tepidariorum]